MKVKNVSELNQDFTRTNAVQGEAIGRTNNARGTNFQPIQYSPGALIVDYIDQVHYYPGGNVTTADADDQISDDSVSFAGNLLCWWSHTYGYAFDNSDWTYHRVWTDAC